MEKEYCILYRCTKESLSVKDLGEISLISHREALEKDYIFIGFDKNKGFK